MTGRTVTALFERYADAEAAIGRLEAAGIPHDDIAILANRSADAPHVSPPGSTPVAGQAEADSAGATGAGPARRSAGSSAAARGCLLASGCWRSPALARSSPRAGSSPA